MTGTVTRTAREAAEALWLETSGKDTINPADPVAAEYIDTFEKAFAVAEQRGMERAAAKDPYAPEVLTPEVVEAAARGIAKRNYPSGVDLDIDEMWKDYVDDAKAALLAALATLRGGV